MTDALKAYGEIVGSGEAAIVNDGHAEHGFGPHMAKDPDAALRRVLAAYPQTSAAPTAAPKPDGWSP